MDYREEYRKKLITAEEAVSKVKSDDMIAVGCAAEEPIDFLRALSAIKGRAENVKMIMGAGQDDYPFMFDKSFEGVLDLETHFVAPRSRISNRLGRMSLFPSNMHHQVLRKLDYQRPNIFVACATPMDRHGYMCISLSLQLEKEFLEAADIVILEINPNFPVVYGDTEVHIKDVDFVFESNNPVPIIPRPKITPEDITIGQYVASLVNDGDTIQLGIGAIPDAAAQAFMDKHDLGLHTEMITNSVVDLYNAGVLTGKKKTLHKGKMIGTFAQGLPELYDFIDENPAVRMLRCTYVNNPAIIMQNDNMVSINSALEVDVTGQICSESIGPLVYSGTGGATDTSVGANHSKGGRSIIAFKSTAKDGQISKIKTILTPGSTVTISRNNVDYIVTEYGIAPLRGRSIRERVNNIIGIAHPDFRQELRKEADKLGIW